MAASGRFTSDQKMMTLANFYTNVMKKKKHETLKCTHNLHTGRWHREVLCKIPRPTTLPYQRNLLNSEQHFCRLSMKRCVCDSLI